MATYQINIQNDVAPDRISEEQLRRIAEAVLGREGQPAATELTVVLADDEAVRALNRQFRQLDSPTDVLSFPVAEGPAFVTPADLPPYLGDVIISYPTALAQAAAQGHPLEEELTLLVVHGCLHLLGYDHDTEEERQRMWARQEEICAGLAAQGD